MNQRLNKLNQKKRKKIKYLKINVNKNVTTIIKMPNKLKTRSQIWLPLKKVKFYLNLEYNVTGHLKTGFTRPVIVHRAIFGSLERFIAILCEQTGGKWDFWLSPRQIKLIPIGKEAKEFADQIYNTLLLNNYSVAIDNTGDQLGKKVRTAQLEGFNFIGIIGPEEIKDKQINLRKRDQEEPIGKFDVAGLLKMFSEARPPKSRKRLEIEEKSFKL